MPLSTTQRGQTPKSTRLWKRLFRSMIVATVIAAMMRLGMFDPIEGPIQEFLLTGNSFGIPGLGLHFELLIVIALTLAPITLRMDQPLLLVAYSACIGFVYLMIASVVLLTTEKVLPIAPPGLGLLASTLIAGSVAWGDERRQRKRLERQDVARQEFTDMLVHDMKKRMSSILMSVSVLERQSSDAAHTPLIATVRASAERMLLLASNLLDIRRVEEQRMTLDREAVSLAKMIKETLAEHQFASDLTGIGVALHEDHDVSVNIDRAIFGRVLSNLYWNALQHAHADSTIDIQWGSQRGRPYVAITNRGDPIPEDAQTELFTAFVSGKSEPTHMPEAGTGLGLTFCKLAMEAHGGDITLTSPSMAFGDGVTVTVQLPAT